MKETKIKFIREYEAYNHTWYDIIYKSGRCHTVMDDISKTAKEFIDKATIRREQYDRTVNRPEVIYMME